MGYYLNSKSPACIFHKDLITEDDRKAFIEFLANLLKDQPYTKLTYMTGVLPIAKYSSGSTINNFKEYDMATKKKYGEYFGFTESEVKELYGRYLRKEKHPEVSPDELKQWYDGYQIASGERLYNPRSVVYALSNNQIADYWTASGSYMEISDYIVDNVDGVKEAIIYMVEGKSVPMIMKAQAATAQKWDTMDEILSSMVVYGFLTYEERTETVRIPNRELMDEFNITVRKEASLRYMDSLARESGRILKATLEGDCRTVEERSGKGYADVLFMPRDSKRDGFVVELKVNHSAEDAVQQIKDNAYALKFKDIAGKKKCRRILAVGINYISDGSKKRDRKRHHCVIEILE